LPNPRSKGKHKAVPYHAMKTCRGRRGIAPLTLNLGARWRSGQTKILLGIKM
jgi:hypothetical protein